MSGFSLGFGFGFDKTLSDIGAGGGGDIPDFALMLNGDYLKLNGSYLTLGAWSPPENAVVYSNFGLGHHWAGNEFVTLGDIWQENTDWGAFNPTLVTASGLMASSVSNPTMSRDYSTSLLSGDWWVVLTGYVDVDATFLMAGTELPGYSRQRQVNAIARATGVAYYHVRDYVALNEINNDPLSAFPNMAVVMAVTDGTVRVAMNYSDPISYDADTGGSTLTDLVLGAFGTDSSAVLTVTYYSGVPTDEQMKAASLVGAPTAPSNVTPPEILDMTTDAVMNTAGVWAGNPLPSEEYTYQWFADDVEISGETNTNYTYQPGDTGKIIKLRETATNGYATVSVYSNEITAPSLSVPEWVQPSNAISFFDFTSPDHYWGGSEVALTDVFGGNPDHTDGLEFNPADVTADGMFFYVQPFSTNRPFAIGSLFTDLKAALATGVTFIWDVDFLNEPYGRFILFLEADTYDDSSNWITVEINGAHASVYVEDQADNFFRGNDNELSIGRHKIGVTLNRDLGNGTYQYAISVDGASATTNIVSYPAFTTTKVIPIGHDGNDAYPLDNAFMKSMIAIPAVDPTTLATLTGA